MTTQGKRQYFFGQDYENCGSFKQCSLCGANQVQIRLAVVL